MGEYRVGVIGLSWITSEPAQPATHPILGEAVPQSHLAALAAIPGVTVVAGCDIVPESTERFLENWRDTWPDVMAYTDYREMLANHDLDMVCVATPDHLHGGIVRDVAASGVKAIFCEKPFTVNLADADDSIAVIEEHGTLVNVNHTRRWMPPYVMVREAVQKGLIGDLAQVVLSFGGPRAMLWRNHAHFIDLGSYFAASDPVWVTAELEPGFEDYGTTYRGDGGRSPELEPGVNAYIAYANGVRVVLNGWKTTTPQVNVDLYGSEGLIHITDQQATLVKKQEEGLASTRLVPRATLESFQAAIQDLLTVMDTGGEVQCPPREARKTVALIEAMLASQATGNSRVPVSQG